MADVMYDLRSLERGGSMAFDYLRGRFRDPFFLARTEDGDRKVKFGNLGPYHGSWQCQDDIDEVNVQLSAGN